MESNQLPLKQLAKPLKHLVEQLVSHVSSARETSFHTFAQSHKSEVERELLLLLATGRKDKYVDLMIIVINADKGDGSQLGGSSLYQHWGQHSNAQPSLGCLGWVVCRG